RGRRQEVMPGGWLWLVILLLLVGILYFTLGIGQAGLIAYSDFLQLLKDGKVEYVELIGPKYLVGDLKKDAKLSDDLRKQIRSNRFTANVPEAEAISGEIAKRLDRAGIKWDQKPDSGAWLGPFLIVVLPSLLILAIIFFFLMPRFRDPLGGG